MSRTNFNVYYKDYKNYLKSLNNTNIMYKPLTTGLLKKTGGRNHKGFITAYNRGGGVRRIYRKICFSYSSLLQKNLLK
jgi:ribosomal protein L2